MRNNNDRIFDLLSGALSSDEEARLRRDIDTDPELAEELRLQTQAIQWLGETDTPLLSEFESAKLRSAVRTSVSQSADTSPISDRTIRPSLRLTWVFAAAAVILALVGTVTVLPRLGGSESLDNVALTEATSAPAGRMSDATGEEDGARSVAEMAAPTTTSAAAAATMAPEPTASVIELSDQSAFAPGDVTASEYLAMLDTSTKRGTLDIDYAANPEALQICLDDLSDDGFTSFQAEVSTYTGDVLFAERFDESGTIVEVVKILVDGCVEIDRAP